MTISAHKIAKFKSWAEGQGGTILPETSEYEVARVEHTGGVLVIYQGKKGISFSCSIARKAWDMFHQKRRYSLVKIQKRSKTENTVRRLRERDGNCCFYCGATFTQDLPVTLEHLLSIKDGGGNTKANLALACQPCNVKAGSLPLVAKVALRDQLRLPA